MQDGAAAQRRGDDESPCQVTASAALRTTSPCCPPHCPIQEVNSTFGVIKLQEGLLMQCAKLAAALTRPCGRNQHQRWRLYQIQVSQLTVRSTCLAVGSCCNTGEGGRPLQCRHCSV